MAWDILPNKNKKCNFIAIACALLPSIRYINSKSSVILLYLLHYQEGMTERKLTSHIVTFKISCVIRSMIYRVSGKAFLFIIYKQKEITDWFTLFWNRFYSCRSICHFGVIFVSSPQCLNFIDECCILCWIREIWNSSNFTFEHQDWKM